MLKVKLICIGKLKETYLTQGIAEYTKRLTPFCQLEILELPEERISDHPGTSLIQKTLEAEGKRILEKIPKGAYVFSLCVEGTQCTSEQLAASFQQIAVDGISTIVFVIGGSHGLSDAVKQSSNQKLSFSKLTFPHQLMRLILVEQIYRAFQISANTSYHK